MTLMTISNNGLELIKRYEGLRLRAYKPLPSEKYYTIGYGHYGSDVGKNALITQDEAERLLDEDLKPIERRLNNMGKNFKQCQFDALCSWIYNLGIGNFEKSTMLKYINEIIRWDDEITDELVKWHKANGKPVFGLKKRRVDEANMFLGKNVYYLDPLGVIRKR